MTPMQLKQLLVGQDHAADAIVPYVHAYEAGLAEAGRPAGAFLLTGPTGSGKTHTIEALAEVLHGNAKCYLAVHCGEYQQDHEVAKLIGAPPGYLGHRETVAYLNATRLKAAGSNRSALAILLFDEIEKASEKLHRLLLGVLDKGQLNLGDGSCVRFDDVLVFFTSNLGVKEITDTERRSMGIVAGSQRRHADLGASVDRAVRKHFATEFLNRIDEVILYHRLSRAELRTILHRLVAQMGAEISERLKTKVSFVISEQATDYMLDRGTSIEHGARELRRLLNRLVRQQLVALVGPAGLPPGTVEIAVEAGTVTVRMHRRLAA